MLADLMDQLRELDKHITAFDERLDAVFTSSAAASLPAGFLDIARLERGFFYH
jgi:hypothetical protein